jgi:hypothetical protein
MAYTYILEFDGATAADYDAVMEKMDLGGDMPPGGLFHGAGAIESGWRVVDVWESAEIFGRFAQEKIGPLTAEVGMRPPEIRTLEVATIRDGAPGAVTFLQVVAIPGLDAAGFDALDHRVRPDDLMPEGLVFHVNGPADGGWYVMDAWTSKALRDEFLETRIKPAVIAAGLTAMPRFDDLELHNSLAAGPVLHV